MSQTRAPILRLARENLKRRPVRSWSMLFLVLVLAFALFATSVLDDSFRGSLDTTLARLGADVIVVPEDYNQDLADSLFLGSLSDFHFERSWLSKLDDIEGIEAYTAQTYIASLAADCCSAPTQLIVFDPESDFIIKPWLEEEGLPLSGPGEFYAGWQIQPAEAGKISFFGQDYRVIGKLDRSNTAFDTCLFMTTDTAQMIMDSPAYSAAFGKPEARADELVSSVMIRVREGVDPKSVARKINYGIQDSPLRAYPTLDVFQTFEIAAKAMNGYSRALMIILLLVVVLALTSIFTLTINERTQEFGLLASLGVRRRRLGAVICLEACLLGLAGGLLASLLGLILLAFFKIPLQLALDLPRISSDPLYLLGVCGKSLGLSLLVALLASAYSAWRIAVAEPAELIKGAEL